MTKRSEKTHETVKDALLALLFEEKLSDITMAALATKANVSRSTLYAHFSNVREVFDESVADFSARLRSLTTHLHQGATLSSHEAGIPFCVALRDAGKYEALVRDPSFLAAFLDLMDRELLETGACYPLDTEMERRARRALMRFQMSGCYAVAMDCASDDDWALLQTTIDAYIRGGINGASTIRVRS